jgi:hypothetical protein
MGGMKNISTKIHNNFNIKNYNKKKTEIEGLGLELPSFSDD